MSAATAINKNDYCTLPSNDRRGIPACVSGRKGLLNMKISFNALILQFSLVYCYLYIDIAWMLQNWPGIWFCQYFAEICHKLLHFTDFIETIFSGDTGLLVKVANGDHRTISNYCWPVLPRLLKFLYRFKKICLHNYKYTKHFSFYHHEILLMHRQRSCRCMSKI